ncbi:MAG: DNA-3-methyladenine glycosylase [Cyclobacteriaceae bacterium]
MLKDIRQYVKLPRTFFTKGNVVEIAENLIGKILYTAFDQQLAAGRIVETEAYCGSNDQACHAFRGGTARNEVMFGDGGYAYVYLCYGVHHLFNIVTNTKKNADAVLVRAVEPLIGIDFMKQRRNTENQQNLTSGPGKLSVALGINTKHNKTDLTGDLIWLMDDPSFERNIVADRRVGVDYAGRDANLPWRFFQGNSLFVSKPVQPSLAKNISN